MKAVEEIGINKSIKFLIYSFVDLILPLFFIPQARQILLSILGSEIGNNSILMKVSFFNWHHKGPKGLTIGKECFIGDETLIDLYNTVTLEDQVTIAQRVTILTHLNVGYSNHPLQQYFPKTSKPVTLKRGSVIGATSTILPGVTIGPGSFVAAGSVVTKDVPNKTLVAGVPAKIIRRLI